MPKTTKKTTEQLVEESTQLLSEVPLILRFECYSANEDAKDYVKYKKGQVEDFSWGKMMEMRVLEVLEGLGYPMDKIGTYLFKDLVTEAKSKISLDEYDSSLKVLRDLASDKSSIRRSLATEYLEISDDSYKKYVLDAMKNIKEDNVDINLARQVCGPDGACQKPGILAYRIAQYLEYQDKKEGAMLVGRFTATTFDDEDIQFQVYDNGIMKCPTLDIDLIRYIHLKPRFELHSETMSYTYDVKHRLGCGSKLIKSYDIDGDLFEYLKTRGMIKYSTEMAYFYGFPDKKGFNTTKAAFKRKKKPEKSLFLQLRGFFN